jgi:O-antigen/teichoic acid export membrane protein
LFYIQIFMDDYNKVLVLTVTAAIVVAIVVGYLFAWRSKRKAHRRMGSLITALVAGFAGLFMLMWLIGAVMPFAPPDGTSPWGPVIFFLAFSPLPLGAFYVCARFLRQIYRES